MKKVISTMVTLALCLSFVIPAFANAKTNDTTQQENSSVLSLKKQNYHYLEGKPGNTHLVYTYESNGSTYKVIENSSKNFDNVNSTIFVKNNSGKFVEFATQHTTIKNSTLTQTTHVNGKTSTETQVLSTKKMKSLNEQGVSPNNSINMASANFSGPGTYCTLGDCYSVTGWQFVSPAQSGSNAIANLTVSAVVGVIVAVATDGNYEAAKYVSTAAGIIAGKLVDDAVGVEYSVQFYYEKRLEYPPVGLENFVVGSNWYTNFYEDSGHMLYVNSTDAYKYQDGFTP